MKINSSDIPKVIDTVVKNDLCIGCGLCVYKCPGKALEMKWNDFGFLVPKLVENCDANGACLTVCPFNPYPLEEIKTENELAEIYLKDACQFHPKIGKYENIYVGYANEFRATSSSGGLATFIMIELLERRIVDHIFSVRESTIPGVHYEYAISNNKQELLASSKTKYFPVTLSTVFSKLNVLEGSVAIIGVACFIKAIRIAQYADPTLKKKIPFLIGIICGGVKSRFFTEYLTIKCGVSTKLCTKPEFRIKDKNSLASDYSFGCIDGNSNLKKTIKMRTVGDMWGTGLFKANACDFCDDVTTELADISLGDAWLSPYNQDGKGNNVIVTRSVLAEKLMVEGTKENKLSLEQLSLNRFLSSQQGSFNHRHEGLSMRLNYAKKQNVAIAPKRFGNEIMCLDFKIVQKLRMKVRKKSLEVWEKNPESKLFDYLLTKDLKQIQWATKIYHYRRAIKRRLTDIFSK